MRHLFNLGATPNLILFLTLSSFLSHSHKIFSVSRVLVVVLALLAFSIQHKTHSCASFNARQLMNTTTMSPSSSSSNKRTWTTGLSTLSLLASVSAALTSESCVDCALNTNTDNDPNSPYTKYKDWEDAPASWEEYGHDNDPYVCGVERLTVEEWEKGKYWNKNKPVIVMNVTDQWPAVKHWTK